MSTHDYMLGLLLREAYCERKLGVPRPALQITVGNLVKRLPGCYASELVPILQARGYWFARGRTYEALEVLVKYGFVREELEYAPNKSSRFIRTCHYSVLP